MLLTLLADLLPLQVNPCGSLLPFLLPVLLVVVAVGVGYRYRERLPGAVQRMAPSQATELDRTADDDGSTSWPSEPPSNEIHEAWLTMVQRANPDRPWTRTPAECARAAVDAGMNPDAVQALTSCFEAVRYAGEPATDERKRRAWEQLQRLDESGGA